ncbi:MAG: MFS transporter [Hyphomicrobium sp.]|nr:MFS transporter [Hyphomicrobium sp.]MBN9266568.1 MFS transporter [Hyphomicrobium sp.]MBN9279200.1 MFS transporter [Hyphomicrobium sp.]
MCVGQVANLLSHVVVPAVMAQHLMPLWGLTASEAGIMASAYSLGYMASVPVLMTLTDRIDARVVLLVGSIVMGAATVAFGLFASGLLSASLLWGLAGIGCAGAYMPGLRAMTDRLGAGDHSRSITLYSACFSLGVGLSFLASQVIADGYGWRMAFVITGIAPIVMVGVCLLMKPAWPIRGEQRLIDFRPVLRNRRAMGYILGYGVHCFELYGFRTWLVAFWSYIIARSGSDAALVDPITLSVIITLLAVPATVLGNEGAIRFGRHRSIATVMWESAVVAFGVVLLVSAPPVFLLVLLLAYAFTLPGDSGALTSGMAMSANASERGATMALHSMVGFGMAALGGVAVGLAIDAAGGPESNAGWSAAFVVMGFSIALGPAVLKWSRKQA